MNRHNHRRLSSRLGAMGCLLIVAGRGISGVDISSYSSPEECYLATFGASPSPLVVGLQGEGREFRDSGNCYLRFQAPAPLLKSLLGGGFRPVTRGEILAETKSTVGPVPAWWAPLSGAPTSYMRSDSFHPTFTRGHAFLSHDAGTRVVYFYWEGLD